MDKWRSVTRGNPCPICGKGDWCGRSDDGQAVICMRVENDSPTKNGGYLYIFRDGAWKTPEKRALLPFPYNSPPPPPPPPKIARKWASAPKRLTTKEVEQFILGDVIFGQWEYGVRDICGDDGFAECYVATAFGLYHSKSHPNSVGILMRDAGGNPVGVRFRNTLTKAKTSLLGGRDGLFFDWTIFRRKVNQLFIVEGATDAICLATLGFEVVGRSSCATGTEHVRQLLNIVRPRDIVYIADNDNAKLIAGKMREAGREGAYKLARSIGKPFRMISPLNAKDIREYILALRKKGLKTAQIRACIIQMVNDSRIQS